MSLSSHLPAEGNIHHITDQPLDIAAILAQAYSPDAGGIVLFSGEVRNKHKGKDVDYIDYEAYTAMAEQMIQEVLAYAKKHWQLSYAFACHRIGKVAIMESAIVVVTAHVHRKEAFEANQYIIDKIKFEAPIWKKEYFADGSSAWGANFS